MRSQNDNKQNENSVYYLLVYYFWQSVGEFKKLEAKANAHK